MKVAEEFEGPQIGFLHQIFRIMVIARQPPRQIVGRIHVRHDDFLEPSECMLIRLLPFFPHMKTAFPGGLFPWRAQKAPGDGSWTGWGLLQRASLLQIMGQVNLSESRGNRTCDEAV